MSYFITILTVACYLAVMVILGNIVMASRDKKKMMS